MPPSLSAIERGNPPPRRKSCAACIKAKRRCDLRQPSCLRCSQRKIDCAYPENPGRKGNNSSDTTSSLAGVSSNVQTQELMRDPLPEMMSWETNFDFNVDLSPSYNSPSCSTFPTISFDTPSIPGLEFLDEVVDMDNTLNSISPAPGPPLGIQEPLPLPVIVRSPGPQIASVSRMKLLRAASELIEKRLRYTVDAFKQAPEEMVSEGGTPWSHPALYRDSMPACLEDAFSACALHRAKNPRNTHMIQRVIQQRYQKLVTAPIPTTSVSELMARTHALILYQIMLYFDDDDQSRTARILAEETASALGDSAMALMDFVRHETEDEDDRNTSHPSRNIPLYPLTTARALYHDWTFQESIRRTLLVAFLLSQLQCLMRADFSTFLSQSFAAAAAATPTSTHNSSSSSTSASTPSPPSYPHPALDTPSCVSSDATTLAAIKYAMQASPHSDASKCDSRMLLCRSLTLSAHLWHARDPVQFAVAWREKKHLVAYPWNIWRRIDAAEPEDIDQLGRMLMTSGMGIDEAEGWFASKGSKL
ncbi:hypothetical protein GGR51DRAFT_46740 [Nemania sp. FL0031]|nr:hypothetical protein GGR51DRAFT_46740 [Nemania sp. FL0031]